MHRRVEVEIREEDLSGLAPEAQERAVEASLLAEKDRRFDWSAAPLFRLVAQRRSDASFQLTLTFHHAILDGWSVASLLAEFARISPALCWNTKLTSP